MDLGNPENQKAIGHFLEARYSVFTVQPHCRSAGPNSYLNAIVNRATWQESSAQGLPLIQTCGRVALKQEEMGG